MSDFIDNIAALFLPDFTWQISARSVTGMAREQNEDSIGFAQQPGGGIAMVADGVGGHNAGEVASSFVCEALLAWFADHPVATDAAQASRALVAAITSIHDKLFQQSRHQAHQAGMATTLAVVMQCKRKAVLAWAGDSRIYLLRKGELQQLSSDHSVVAEKIRRGELTPEEATHHPLGNLITSALGDKPRITHLGLETLALEKNDMLLLCSDGISGMLDPKQLTALIPEGVDALINAAQEAHSSDDCSAVIVTVKGR